MINVALEDTENTDWPPLALSFIWIVESPFSVFVPLTTKPSSSSAMSSVNVISNSESSNRSLRNVASSFTSTTESLSTGLTGAFCFMKNSPITIAHTHTTAITEANTLKRFELFVIFTCSSIPSLLLYS